MAAMDDLEGVTGTTSSKAGRVSAGKGAKVVGLEVDGRLEGGGAAVVHGAHETDGAVAVSEPL